MGTGGDGCRLTPAAHLDRRAFLSMMSIGAAALLTGCVPRYRPALPAAGAAPTEPTTAPPDPVGTAPAAASLNAVGGPIPPPHPGPPHVIGEGPASAASQLALTIDDGTCDTCVANYVAFAERSGVPLTFSPNGRVRDNWEPAAKRLRALIEAGQVQIANHTWSHSKLTERSSSDIRGDIERNEAWIQDTFGITSRPWFRPPYGAHSARTDGVAGELGFTRILLWNGTFGDSGPIKPDKLMQLATRYITGRGIMLGHANHDTIFPLLQQIEQLIYERELQPVTLDTMFGTSRLIG